MKLTCLDSSNEQVCVLDIYDIPHLDAVFEYRKKNYKIVSFEIAGTKENPEYKCIVKKVGKDQCQILL